MRRAILAALIGAVAGGLLTYWLFPRVETRVETEVRVDTVRVVQVEYRVDTVAVVPDGLLSGLRAVLPADYHPVYERVLDRHRRR